MKAQVVARARALGGKLPEPVKRSLRKAAGRLQRQRPVDEVWSESLEGEADYWREHLATRPADLAWRLDPESSIAGQPTIGEAVGAVADEKVSILDVGSGPLTTLGKTYPGKQLEIIPIDPLAAQYDAILSDLGMDPPARTVVGEGETLLDQFSPGRFDIAYASNSLDHSYDPVRTVRNMVEVVKRGGRVILRHRENEATNRGYRGLHQWNIELRDGELWFWNRAERHAIGAALGDSVKIECTREHDEVVAVMTKV